MDYKFKKNYGLKKIPWSLRISPEVDKEIREEAKSNLRSLTNEVEFILKKYFEKRKNTKK